MTITITVPSDTQVPLNLGHTTDHNAIADALTALGNSAANTAGDTFSGSTEFDGGVVLGTATPSTPASGKSVLYTGSTGVATAKLDSAYAGALSLGSPADHSSHTATGAAVSAITASWTIPANDGNVGTLYRLTFAGFGTWGTTQEQLNVQVLIDGVSAVAGSGSVAATEFPISQGIWIRGVAEVVIVTTGVGGSMTVWEEYTANARAANLTGTAAQNSISIVDGNNTTGATSSLDTTASHTLSIGAFWTSTTGAPTITGSQSYFERLGA